MEIQIRGFELEVRGRGDPIQNKKSSSSKLRLRKGVWLDDSLVLHFDREDPRIPLDKRLYT